MIQFNIRYYDAEVGRFISRDTVLTEKAYLYCEGDPVNRLDPSGHTSLKGVAVGAAVGATVTILIGVAVEIGSGGTLTPIAVAIVDVGVGAISAGSGGYAQAQVDHENPWQNAGWAAIGGAILGPVSGALPGGSFGKLAVKWLVKVFWSK